MKFRWIFPVLPDRKAVEVVRTHKEKLMGKSE